MSRIKTFLKKLLIPLSLIVSLFIIIMFTLSVLSSRHDIPTALQDVYGDTSGIHGLTISGKVSDMQKHFSYEFKLDDNNAMIWTSTYSSKNDVNDNIMTNKYYFSSFTYNPQFLANYIPIEPYKTEIIMNRNSIHDSMSSSNTKDIPYYIESFFISGDSIIFLSSSQGTTCPDIWVFDLSEEGLEHVLTIEAANLWDMDEAQTDYHYIVDVIWKDNMLYVAEFTNGFSNVTNEAHISSFSQDGTLVGRCKLLCGVEEDSSSFWFAGRGSIQSTYMRSLQTIIIMN